MKIDETVIIRGYIKGKLNDHEFSDTLINAYAITVRYDGRLQISISNAPRELGKKSTLLLPVATPIYWLFGTAYDGLRNTTAVNGFRLTG